MWPQRSPKDGPRMSKIKIYQKIYKIYQNISEIIINIDKNHKIYTYFIKMPNFLWRPELIRMVPHLGVNYKKVVHELYKIVSESGSDPSVFYQIPSPVRKPP